jgi:integrase/recombinase XerC
LIFAQSPIFFPIAAGRIAARDHAMTSREYTKLLHAFQRHLRARKKHANTIRSYSNDVKQFHAWAAVTLGPGFTMAEVTRGDLSDFRSFLLTRRISATSINRRITALRQFFDFCVGQQLMAANPAVHLTGIPNLPAAPSILAKRDALLLIRTAEQSAGYLEASIVLLLLHAGLRSSEICAITVGDLQLTPRVGRLFIGGQRDKTMRFARLTTRTQAALRMYCRRQNITILGRNRRSDPLLRLPSGHPLTQQAVDHIVKRVARGAGIPDVTPTMLRNTFAVYALLSGEQPETVARSLGVASVRGLVRYVETLRHQAA